MVLCQCWCFNCAGRVVDRRTFLAHGRKVKPDSPIRPAEIDLVPIDVAGELDDAEEVISSDEESVPEEIVDLSELLDEPDESGKSVKVGLAQLSRPEVLVLFLDWITNNKLTDKAAQGAWDREAMYHAAANVSLPSWHWVKRKLRTHADAFVTRIDICRNDCVVYWDSVHTNRFRNSHRTKCPVCNASRYVTVNGDRIPAKVIYHFPLRPFIRNLFARKELVPHLYTDCGERPEGHVSRSRGFQRKIHDNPMMNEDHRNIALVGMTDGVPYFNDKKRGAWPFLFRVANLPDSLSTHVSNVHLGLLSANEYWDVDPDTGKLTRQIRGPKQLNAHLAVLVDDLLGAYREGTY